MPFLYFPNPHRLRTILANGLLPVELTRAPVRYGTDENQQIWVEAPELSRNVLGSLARLGVRACGSSDIPTLADAPSWAAILPLTPGFPPLSPELRFLFRVSEPVLAAFVSRLQRFAKEWGFSLGEDRQAEWAWVVAQRVEPSLILHATDSEETVEAYVEAKPGVWVRWGWQHPLPEHIIVEAGTVALLAPPNTLTLYRLNLPSGEPDNYALPERPVAFRSSPQSSTEVTIRLRLVPRHDHPPPELWVIESSEAEQFWTWAAEADDKSSQRFEAAQPADRPGTWVVRYRGPQPPVISCEGQAYVRHDALDGLYLPRALRLCPRLRPEALARVVAYQPDQVQWLCRSHDGPIECHRLPVSAFQPIKQWIHFAAPPIRVLTPEADSDLFSLPDFKVSRIRQPTPVAQPVTTAHAPEPSPAQCQPPRPARYLDLLKRWLNKLRRKRSSWSEVTPTATQSTEAPSSPPPERVEQQLASPEVLLHGPAWLLRRRFLEDQLVRDVPVLQAAERARRWAELAVHYTRAGHHVDAAICWMNAVWDAPEPATEWVKNWLAAECRLARLPGDFEVLANRLMGPKMADPARVIASFHDFGSLTQWSRGRKQLNLGRVIAAFAVYVNSLSPPPAEFLSALPRLMTALEQQFDHLPLRAAWLGGWTLMRACGDVLGLARWHDRLLARLNKSGPALDVDEPSFVRFHGTPLADRFAAARDWLVRVREQAVMWVQRHGSSPFRWSHSQGTTNATCAYAQLMFAWGLGCLGERTKAQEWAGESRQILEQVGESHETSWLPRSERHETAAVHALLADLFSFRIREAQEGHRRTPGLTPEHRARFEALSEQSRYAVNQLQEYSRILEPHERVLSYDVYKPRSSWGQDQLGERLSIFVQQTEASELAAEAEAWLQNCERQPSVATFSRIVQALIEVAPRLPPPLFCRALSLLPQAVESLDPWLQSRSHRPHEIPCGVSYHATRIFNAAFTAAAEVVAPEVAEVVSTTMRRLLSFGPMLREPLLRACVSVFRALHRLGLYAEAADLVRHLDAPLQDPVPTPDQVRLAIGWYVIGNEEAGNRILDRVRDLLYQKHLRGRTRLAIAYAAALGYASPGIAYGRLEELFQRLEGVDTQGSWNNHYILRPLILVDTVVRSVVSDGHRLGRAVRDWLGDEEYVIRCRIRRDMAEALGTTERK